MSSDGGKYTDQIMESIRLIYRNIYFCDGGSVHLANDHTASAEKISSISLVASDTTDDGVSSLEN